MCILRECTSCRLFWSLLRTRPIKEGQSGDRDIKRANDISCKKGSLEELIFQELNINHTINIDNKPGRVASLAAKHIENNFRGFERNGIREAVIYVLAEFVR